MGKQLNTVKRPGPGEVTTPDSRTDTHEEQTVNMLRPRHLTVSAKVTRNHKTIATGKREKGVRGCI
jgi:hypothetical protein